MTNGFIRPVRDARFMGIDGARAVGFSVWILTREKDGNEVKVKTCRGRARGLARHRDPSFPLRLVRYIACSGIRDTHSSDP